MGGSEDKRPVSSCSCQATHAEVLNDGSSNGHRWVETYGRKNND